MWENQSMTDEEIQVEIAFQRTLITSLNAELLAAITQKSTVNTSDGQTQLMVVNRPIGQLQALKTEAVAELDRLIALLSGGGMLQLRPF
jgi:hypothetical protein